MPPPPPPLLLLLGLCGSASLALAKGGFTLHFVDAGSNDPPSGPPPPLAAAAALQAGAIGQRRRLQRPMIPFWLKAASYDGDGRLRSVVNVTKPKDGMGYVSISGDGTKAMFASEMTQPQGWKNVETEIFELTADGSAKPGSTPKALLDQDSLSALIEPCATAKPIPCTQISTFHAIFTADSTQVVFAYRAWSSLGEGIGRQSIAIANIDGSGARQLTYNETDAGDQDECPSITADGSTILFTRSDGEHTTLAVLDVASGTTTMRHDLPEMPPGAGCPAWLGPASPNTFMWLGCTSGACGFAKAPDASDPAAADAAETAMRWGTRAPLTHVQQVQARGGPPFAQYKVKLGSVAADGPAAHTMGSAVQMFPVCEMDAPNSCVMILSVLPTKPVRAVWCAHRHNRCSGPYWCLRDFPVRPCMGRCSALRKFIDNLRRRRSDAPLFSQVGSRRGDGGVG
jgi:hypothetical protein